MELDEEDSPELLPLASSATELLDIQLAILLSTLLLLFIEGLLVTSAFISSLRDTSFAFGIDGRDFCVTSLFLLFSPVRSVDSPSGLKSTGSLLYGI